MNRKETYADLDKWRRTKNAYFRRYYDKTTDAPNRGQGWTVEEERLVLEHSMSDHELSRLIGRSVKAIQIKRSKLRKGEQ